MRWPSDAARRRRIVAGRNGHGRHLGLASLGAEGIDGGDGGNEGMGRRDPDPRRAGFTLIEVTVVLIILVLAYALVAPAVPSFFAAARLDGAARSMVTALREARSTAIVTGQELRFTLDPTARSWRFGARRGALDQKVRLELETPPGARSSDGGAWIGFFPDGHSTGGRIVLESGGRTRFVDVYWLTGRVSQTAR